MEIQKQTSLRTEREVSWKSRPEWVRLLGPVVSLISHTINSATLR